MNWMIQLKSQFIFQWWISCKGKSENIKDSFIQVSDAFIKGCIGWLQIEDEGRRSEEDEDKPVMEENKMLSCWFKCLLVYFRYIINAGLSIELFPPNPFLKLFSITLCCWCDPIFYLTFAFPPPTTQSLTEKQIDVNK